MSHEQGSRKPVNVITAVLAYLGRQCLSMRLRVRRAPMVTFELRDRPSRAGGDGHRTDCRHARTRARRRIRVADPFAADDACTGFQRFDRTPPYFEDLRTLYAMPILDWALIFKPQFWLFFVAPPAIAYSFYHFLLIAMFVVGFTILFVQLGGRELDSFLMALVLYFSSYTQYWWDGATNSSSPSSRGSCSRCCGIPVRLAAAAVLLAPVVSDS